MPLSTVKRLGKIGVIAATGVIVGAGFFAAGYATLSAQMVANTAANRGLSLSAETARTYGHADAAAYCYTLSAAPVLSMDGNTSTIYTDWRLPTVSEAAIFERTITSENYIWTSSVRDATSNLWLGLRLSDGSWTVSGYTSSTYVRCVR